MASIAPSIFGHEDIKRGLALALFGGQPKDKQVGTLTYFRNGRILTTNLLRTSIAYVET